MDLYNGKINEYVDWITGQEREFEEGSTVSYTGGLAASGGAIRELLQTKLQHPIVVIPDEDAGLNRIFSSDAAFRKWQTAKDNGAEEEDLRQFEIFNFERPTDWKFRITGMSNDTKYVVLGDKQQSGCNFNLGFEIFKDNGDKESQPITISISTTYKGNKYTHQPIQVPSSIVNSGTTFNLNIYDYLKSGVNGVHLEFKPKGISIQPAYDFDVNVVQFQLEDVWSSDTNSYNKGFSPYQSGVVNSGSITVPVRIRRNITGFPMEVRVYVDGSLAKKYENPNADAIFPFSDSGQVIPGEVQIYNSYSGSDQNQNHIHTLQLHATMSNGSYTFMSNILYYTFETLSSVQGLRNKIINFQYSIDDSRSLTSFIDNQDFKIILTQYQKFYLNWGYYTDHSGLDQQKDIDWYIKAVKENDGTDTIVQQLGKTTGINRAIKDKFGFTPIVSEDEGFNYFIVGSIDNTEILNIPIQIIKSSISLYELPNYALKLQAVGKSNSSTDKNIWSFGNITTTFNNISWDSNSGWDGGAFVTSGQNENAIINYKPFDMENVLTGGLAIDIDFMSEKVSDDSDVILKIGMQTFEEEGISITGGGIEITPTRATLYGRNRNEVVHTNYKANERIHLCFIINKSGISSTSGLAYIINNGILERAESAEGYQFTDSEGKIYIGGSDSGIRLYSIRVYQTEITYKDAYNLYVYDSDNKYTISANNDILDAGSNIDYELTVGKLDTIVIEGNLTELLKQGPTKTEATVNITREGADSSYKFTATDIRIRKHGQSTLNYPITSFKMWFNKPSKLTPNATSQFKLENELVQRAQDLNKNRYIMKEGAIPANKFVLQANYADSSGTHNGSLLRLINDSWYNARINGEYKLRTAPQLFASNQIVHHNNENLHEVEYDRTDPDNPILLADHSWIEGYSNVLDNNGELKYNNSQWKDFSGNKDFPYKIRIAPDSFPCAVFYRNTAVNNKVTFLGQYVFMDDKKSDFCFGERSIYSHGDKTDPFCLKITNSKNDKDSNKVWDNKDVLRIECVQLDTPITSFMTNTVTKNGQTYSVADRDPGTNNYFWENYFEMIYPDPEDIEKEESKFVQNGKYQKKMQPFITLLDWLASTYGNQQKFEQEAHDHLDLYKLAAYYIFFLRFGLVDSVERNAQLKTYDGQHWHYEPWDMDIALGNKNDGGIAFDPPIDRDTKLPGEQAFAFSGRSNNPNGTRRTSNWLWDALEAWDYWANTLVREVATALYETGGLTYNSAVNMFDNEYAAKWCETIYNLSGLYKYVTMRGNDDDWLRFLQGARTSHRHWWLSTSMNYYDAKWSCGDFNMHQIYIGAYKAAKDANSQDRDLLTITPTGNTFFKLTQNSGLYTIPDINGNNLSSASKSNPSVYDLTERSFNVKDPTHIFGATFIEKLDVSCIARSLSIFSLAGAYDNVLGAPIKELNMGIPATKVSDTEYTGAISNTVIKFSGSQVFDESFDELDDIVEQNESSSNDALNNLRKFNITGINFSNTNNLLVNSDRKYISEFIAMGSGLNSFSSAPSGNRFDKIWLPSKKVINGTSSNQFTSFSMSNSSWNDLSFWETTVTNEQTNEATFTKVNIPATITNVSFTGSTASQSCSAAFIKEWIASIETASGNAANMDNVFKNYYLEARNINWGASEGFTYSDLEKIASMNGGKSSRTQSLTGRIVITDNQDLTPAQASNLKAWFGETVFSIDAQATSLVVDHQRPYIQISIGSGAEVNNQGVFVNEGSTFSVIATKFSLGGDTEQYRYDFMSSNDQNAYTIPAASNISLETNQLDGLTYITIDESDHNDDYNIYMRAMSTSDPSNPQYSSIITITVRAKTQPTGVQLVTSASSGNDTRRVYLTEEIATDLFQNDLSQVYTNHQMRETYILYKPGQRCTFDLQLMWPENAENKATEISRSFTINNNAYSDQQLEAGVLLSDVDVVLRKQSGDSGITFILPENLPATMVVKTFSGLITMKGGSTFSKTVNIIIWNDPDIILAGGAIYNILFAMYNTLYNNVLQNNTPLYKSHLIGISGNVTIQDQPIVSYVSANVNNPTSIFRYLPYISSLTIDNSQISLDYNNVRIFDFSQCKSLRTVAITNIRTNIENLQNPIIDFSDAPQITSFITSNGTVQQNTVVSYLGIKLGQGSNMTNIHLASPRSIDITNPTSLTENQIIVDDDTYLTTLSLVGVNSTALCGYKMFDKIYTP